MFEPLRQYTQSPLSNQSINAIGEIISDYSEHHTEHQHTLHGQNVEFLNVKPGGT